MFTVYCLIYEYSFTEFQCKRIIKSILKKIKELWANSMRVQVNISRRTSSTDIFVYFIWNSLNVFYRFVYCLLLYLWMHFIKFQNKRIVIAIQLIQRGVNTFRNIQLFWRTILPGVFFSILFVTFKIFFFVLITTYCFYLWMHFY